MRDGYLSRQGTCILTELEQLLEDYYRDNAYIQAMKYEWIEPIDEKQQLLLERKLLKSRRKFKDIKSYLNERSSNEREVNGKTTRS